MRIMRKKEKYYIYGSGFPGVRQPGKPGVHKTDTVGKDNMRGRTRLSFQRQQEETGQRRRKEAADGRAEG